MALQNHDVLYTPKGQSYNVDRLHQFILNVDRGIPDCIIITTFGLDAPAVIAVLYYDGEKIIYTFDASRYSNAYKMMKYYGLNIFAITHKPTLFTETTYYLEIPSDEPFFIFRDYLEI
jgi:hypothetical protein